MVWQDNVRKRGSEWTEALMQRAFDRFTDIFGVAPRTHGAAGWQMNPQAFRQLDAFGFEYASDGRARLKDDGSLVDPAAGPYRITHAGKTMACIQLPTTLPTLDELLGRTSGAGIIDASNIAAKLLGLTETPRDHVFTLHAELEGQKLAPILKKLLAGWKSQGYTLGSMAGHHAKLRDQPLPSGEVRWGSLPGRSGELIVEQDLTPASG